MNDDGKVASSFVTGARAESPFRVALRECQPEILDLDRLVIRIGVVGIAVATGVLARSIIAALSVFAGVVGLLIVFWLLFFFARACGVVGAAIGGGIYDLGVAMSRNGRNVLARPQTLVALVSSALLLWALADHEYGYYEFLRVVCCPVLAYFAWRAAGHRLSGWVFAFGFGALLYNPFASPDFEREVWSVINVLTAAALLVFAFRPAAAKP